MKLTKERETLRIQGPLGSSYLPSQDRQHNLQGSVQNENAGLLVEMNVGVGCGILACSQGLVRLGRTPRLPPNWRAQDWLLLTQPHMSRLCFGVRENGAPSSLLRSAPFC